MRRFSHDFHPHDHDALYYTKSETDSLISGSSEFAIYRVDNMSVTGTPAQPQLVLYSSLTDADRGGTLPASLSNARVVVQSRSDRLIYIPTRNNVGFTIAAGDGSAPSPTVDLLITSYSG